MANDSKRMVINVGADALKMLIGGDSDVELQVRQAIVHEFSKRHLRGIANEETLQRIASELRQDMDACGHRISHELGFVKDFGNRWKPNAELTAAIKQTVDSILRDSINRIAKECISEINLQSLIAAQIDRTVQLRIADGVRDELNKIAANLGK